eukprot:TRINITY_DN5175_c0_g1_i1.p1 TRINITY_DN5175_c0_g1~~TRINITY_DN5175_c0_g1_i1.p1  ORF type:complete len:778 (+),score=142.56 TRINITY_DN5175_c0_g1_i1:80-2413(+)
MDSHSAAPDYRLRCELRGHAQDVRGICICGEDNIASGSRDQTVRYWALDATNNSKYILAKTMLGHTSFVGPVCWVPPNAQLPEGGIVSGGMDTLVLLWDLKSAQPVYSMRGHQYQVTGVALDEQEEILSSSIDCTVRRWRNGQCVESWQAHQSPVQAILKLPSGEIVTGSSDSTIKIWHGSKNVRTLPAHSDTVRRLAVMPNLGFLSASHDGSIKLWALAGELLMEMVGHTSLVYSVAAVSDPVSAEVVIASGSEDHFLKLWKDGTCFQTIEHPGCVWDVKFLPNGDVVSACSDGVIRIWTKAPERMASDEEIQAFESNLCLYKCETKKVGGIRVSDLPGPEALQQPGTKHGQTLIIREGDSGVAYSWNSKEYMWDKIGEVVDGPDASQGGKQMLDGIPYDYVFDVDIGDGEPTRKLPYNRGDNPYSVADQWLLKEGLPLLHREQVVEFIVKNTGQSSNVPSANSFSYVDPYTGANAYVPGQQSSSTSASVSGSSKYNFKHIPKKGFLVFDSAQYDGIMRKVAEFNSALSSSNSKEQDQRILSGREISQLNAIVAVLKDTSHYHSTTFGEMDMKIVMKMLISWPVEMLFPVLDLVKMIVLHPHGASMFSSFTQGENDLLMNTVRRVTSPPIQPSNQLTCLRLLVNTFKHSCFKAWLTKHRSDILDIFSDCCSSSNKNIRLGFSTLILNYSVLLSNSGDKEGQLQVLSASMEMADSTEQDSDVRFRALVALGSLMHDNLVKKQAIDLDVESIIKSAAHSQDKRVAEIGEDLGHLSKMG